MIGASYIDPHNYLLYYRFPDPPILQTSTVPSTSSSREGVKHPKLDVPSFDRNILNWETFWDQFCISVHDCSNLSDAEKLVCLQQSLRDGPAKCSIEGLSRSGECYPEAIECLQSRYDRPRLIHQTHVRMILEAPPLKSGDGRELCRLHDTVQQHIRALKAMDCEPSGPFITSIVLIVFYPATTLDSANLFIAVESVIVNTTLCYTMKHLVRSV